MVNKNGAIAPCTYWEFLTKLKNLVPFINKLRILIWEIYICYDVRNTSKYIQYSKYSTRYNI